jgi:hypothetical protein
MEKLKCTSCGGNLDVEENNKYAVCKHCGAKYKLDKDLNINIKMDDNTKDIMDKELKMFKDFRKPTIKSVIVKILSILIAIFVAFMIVKDIFNFQFTYDNGTQSSLFVKNTLDEIVESNHKHIRKVTLVYDGKETRDEREIAQIKKELRGTYEVSFVYSKLGFIEKIVIE